MIASQLAEETVQVALISSGTHANLACGHLGRHFGMKLADAEVLLHRGFGVISAEMPRATAAAALPVLTALGLQVALLPKNAEPPVELSDLSIRLKQADAIHRVRSTLARLGWTGDVTPADFCGPAGFVMNDLPRGKAEDYRAALRALAGVSATLSAQSSAVYDVFAPSGFGQDMTQILRHLSAMSCSAEDLCPQIAVSLDRHMLKRLLARFPNAGLIGVNQAFQRYHLTLTAPGRISIQELADFLATRGCSVAQMNEAVASRRGMRLESGLTRTAAKQFVADYATIGIIVRADLARG